MPAEATRPTGWVALGALLVAPVAATIVSALTGLVLGYETSFSLEDRGIDAAVFGVLFLVLGGPLIVVFWKRAPFGALSCLAVGGACGSLLGFYALSVVQPGNYARIEGEAGLEFYLGATIIVAQGVVAGLAGGLAFSQICRMGSRTPA
jgi:hypothetical protein